MTWSRNFQHDVFVYADDIAILCLGYSDIRAALDIVERWSVANSMELNKKKCGILIICKRSMPLSRRDVGSVPFESEYYSRSPSWSESHA